MILWKELMNFFFWNYKFFYALFFILIHFIFTLTPAATLIQNISSVYFNVNVSQHATPPTHTKSHMFDLIGSRGLDVTVTNVLAVTVSGRYYIFPEVFWSSDKTNTNWFINSRYISASAFSSEFSKYTLLVLLSCDDISQSIDHIAPVRTVNVCSLQWECKYGKTSLWNQ